MSQPIHDGIALRSRFAQGRRQSCQAKRVRLVVVMLALAACTDDRSAVSGRYIERLYTLDGVVDRPRDMSEVTFQVFSAGNPFPATQGTFDGTVYVPDIPDGPYVLKITADDSYAVWYARDAHEFEDISSRVGRPDGVLATNAPLHLRLEALAAWGADDFLIADCWENGTEHYPIALQPQLAPGATRVDGTVDWSKTDAGAYLLEADAGDTLTVSRITMDPRTDVDRHKLTQYASGSAPSQRNGELSEFAAAFVDVAATRALTIDVDTTAFADAVPARTHYWGVSVMKGPASRFFDRLGPELLGVGKYPDGSGQFSLTESYGDPFDPSWQTVVTSGYGTLEPTRLPDGSSLFLAPYAFETRHLDGDHYTLGPIAGHVSTATLAGHPLTGDIPWDGTSPLALHLDVPPDHAGFGASIYRLAGAPGDLAPQSWAGLRSDGSDITLPSTALRAGELYVLRVIVSDETETSRSGVASLLGPFRLVVP
jgi:hypothetical protein